MSIIEKRTLKLVFNSKVCRKKGDTNNILLESMLSQKRGNQVETFRWGTSRDEIIYSTNTGNTPQARSDISYTK